MRRFPILVAITAALAVSGPDAGAAESCAASSPFSALTLVAGDIIVTDITVNAVYRLTADGSTCTIVSSGGLLDSPRAVVVGPTGTIFVTDSAFADAVIRIDPALPPTANQVIVTRQGAFTNPRGIVIDSTGDFLVAEPELDRIYRVNPVSGAQSIFAAAGWGEETFQFPSDIALEASAPCGTVPETYGCLLVTDAPSTLSTVSKRLLRVASSGGFPSVRAKDGLLKFPRGVAIEASGDAVIADSGTAGPPASPPSLIRVTPGGAQTCVPATCLGVTGGLLGPRGIAVESNGSLLVADFTARAVYRVHPTTGERDTLLFDPSLGPWGIAVVGNVAQFNPSKLLVADSGAGTIVKVTPAAATTPLAVTPIDDPDDELTAPVGVTRTPSSSPWFGKILVADAVTEAVTDAAVRAVDDSQVSPTVTTIAEGGNLGNVTGIAVDAGGDVLVTDDTADAVVRIEPNGSQSPVRCAPPGPNETAVDLTNPVALAIDRDGLLVVATSFQDTTGARARILRMNPGTGAATDGNPGVACRTITEDPRLHDVRALAIDPSGDVLIADDVPLAQTTPTIVDSVWRIDAHYEDLKFVMSLPTGVLGSFRGVVADTNRDVIVANILTPEAAPSLPELLRIDPLVPEVSTQIASGTPFVQIRGIALDAAPPAFPVTVCAGGPVADPVADCDGDLVGNSIDNCRDAANPDQLDSDFDTKGDVCDLDDDNDGVDDGSDNCPFNFNPVDETTLVQLDTDSDGRGDACDNCATVHNPGQENHDLDALGDDCDSDDDNDSAPDTADNCQFVANFTQVDTDQDGYGQFCDFDFNNDGSLVNNGDFALALSQVGNLTCGPTGVPPCPGPPYNCCVCDFNQDGICKNGEAAAVGAQIGKKPGPSGLACAGTPPCPLP